MSLYCGRRKFILTGGFFIFLFMVNGRGIFICSAGYQVMMEKKAEVSIQCTKIVLIAALISVFNRFWGGRSPANIYLFKFNNRNTRKRCEMCSKLTIKTPERCHWRHSGVSIVNFERISHLFLVFLLLNLNKKMLPGEQWNKIDKNGLVFSWIRSSLNRSQWTHEPK